jgi:hypothetical protein
MVACVSAFVIGAVAAPAAAVAVTTMSGQPQSSHNTELAIKRSMPNGRTDVIKAR